MSPLRELVFPLTQLHKLTNEKAHSERYCSALWVERALQNSKELWELERKVAIKICVTITYSSPMVQ